VFCSRSTTHRAPALQSASSPQKARVVGTDAVQAANRRSRARYLACAASGRTDCADPEYLTPSWNSGMRVRWAPAAQGAYPPGAEPGGTDSMTISIFLVVAGGLVTVASGLWLAGVIRRQRAA
jgi:hypothetical protein